MGMDLGVGMECDPDTKLGVALLLPSPSMSTVCFRQTL